MPLESRCGEHDGDLCAAALFSFHGAVSLRHGILAILLLFVAEPASANSSWSLARHLVRDNVSDTELIEGVNADHPAARKAALFRMMQIRSPSFEPPIVAALSDPVWSVRRMACRAAETMRLTSAVIPLEKIATSSESAPVRARAVMALAAIGDTRSRSVLEALLDDPDFAVRGTAAQEITRFPNPPRAKLDDLAANDPFVYVRARAGVPDAAPPRAKWPIIVGTIIAVTSLLIAARFFPRFIVPAVIGAGLIFFIIQSLPRSEPKSKPVELILDDDLKEHPLIAAMGGGDLFLAEMRKKIEASGLAQAPIARFGGSTEMDQALDPLRKQYNMDHAMANFRDAQSETAVVFITGRHLYQEPYYTVLGHAGPNGGVVSVLWIDPVFLGLSDGSTEDLAIFQEFMAKVLVHEIGHTRGLPHCDNKGCVMQSVEEASEEFHLLDEALCDACRRKIE